MRVARWFAPFKVPVMVAVTFEDTGIVFTVKVAVVAPASTVTDGGTVTPPLFELSATTTPPVGAGPLNVAVPVVGFPPYTVEGLSDIPMSAVGLIVKVADWVPTSVPLIVTVVTAKTGTVLT